MHGNGKIFYLRIFFLLISIFTFAAVTAFAKKEKVRWEYHKSVSGAFDARFPSNYKIKSSPLRVDDETVLFRVEVTSEIEDEDNPEAPKRNYSIKVDQTLGEVIGSSKIEDLLNRDVFKFKKATKALGAKLESQQDVNIDGFIGKEFMFSFTENGAEQGLRVKVMYTDVSRVEAVLAGPQPSMYSFKANEFFNSLKLYDGNARIPGKIGEGWAEYVSPLGIFTLVLPDEKNTYALGAPKFVKEEKREQGRFSFKDPVLGHRTFFNFFGYQIQQEKNFGDVKVLLHAEHVSKYLPNFRLEDLKFDERMATDGSHGILSTKIRLRGLEKYPYVTAVIIQALFNKDGIVVLEYMGSLAQVDAPLGKTLFSLVKFHPEKSYQKPETSSSQGMSSSVAPAEETLEDADRDQDDEDSSADADSVDGEGNKGPSKSDDSAIIEEDKQTLKATIKLGEPQSAENADPEHSSEPNMDSVSAEPAKGPKDPAVAPPAEKAPVPAPRVSHPKDQTKVLP